MLLILVASNSHAGTHVRAFALHYGWRHPEVNVLLRLYQRLRET